VAATCFFSSVFDGRAALATASINMLMHKTPIDSRRMRLSPVSSLFIERTY
jgi:hypothetical protein